MATLSAAQVAGYAQSAGFSGDALHIIVAIAEAESGFDTNAHNPGGPGDTENSWGLWQINLDAHPEVTVQEATDPTFAANYAYKLYKTRNGFSDWGTYNTGRYLQMASWANPPVPTSGGNGGGGGWSAAMSVQTWPWLTSTGTSPDKINNPYHSSFEAGRGAVQDGVGVAVPLDTPITSLTAGVVMASAFGSDLNSGWNYGGFIVVRSQIPSVGIADVFYRHMDTLAVKKGDTVKVGQELGLSGGQIQGGAHPESAAYTTGPHIDIGINPSTLPYQSAGANVDPTSWLNTLIAQGPPARDALGMVGGAGISSTPFGYGAQKVVALSDMVAQGVGPVGDSFVAIEARMDYVMQFIPIDWSTISKDVHWWDFVLPWQWQQTQQTVTANVAGAIFHNSTALCFRVFFVILGMMVLTAVTVAILFAIAKGVASNPQVQQSTKTAATLAPLALAAAA